MSRENSPPTRVPSEVFAALGDETRMDVLRALAESWNRAGFELDYALSFTDLLQATGVEDSGRFNYHLQRLTDHFVRKTDDGYEFRYLGWKIARLILSEGIHEPYDVEPLSFSSTCYACSHGTLVGRYVNEWLWIRCPACETPITDVEMRPHVVTDRSRAEVVALCDRRTRRRIDLFLDGVCADCLDDTELTAGTHAWGPDEFVRLIHECSGCDTRWLPAMGWYALDDPRVVAFYADRGVDVASVPYWELGPLVSDAYTTVVGPAEAPERFVIEFSCRGDTVSVSVDDCGTVRGVGETV
jgi:DNA-binding transcriptional ArsR family regulator